MTDHDMIGIASDRLSAAINPMGAELTHLRDAAGRDLMTDADPAFWPKHAPILFPVIGCVGDGTIRLAGKSYAMPKHGFARDHRFEVIETTAASARFQLTDNAATRAHYPYAFALEIGFTITAATLAIDARITNRSGIVMPAQFGFHPAFAWPLPYGAARGDHMITFSTDEPGALKRVDAEGLIADRARRSPLEGRVLALDDALFTDDALIWDPVHSSSVRYGAGAGPALDVAFPDTPALGIWTKPGAAFVCIEPWHGIADPHDFTGDFRSKPGVFTIPPGQDKRIGMAVTLVA
ncbi:aldose 1-epimerase family protein [Hephaestia sp. GCM10023244]|uniref:aldose 1-epimerase family protein n=1 Tax=unclassified Hephaestia TaxID=2631281 RepID=UPI0020774FCF|nr:aldose 1-epimerase family protein [Hephaestia sp. MAHUQ-44]MCM8732211.1 aldose 1-epimerase family protein [Hephaestia sp. MAHUQ-44]